jgi:hypothetical protein
VEADCAKKLCLTALTTDEVFQTDIVLLDWRLGFRVDEIPVEISELRPSPVKVLRRVPKVLNIVWELKRSLSRFPTPSSRLDLATVSATNSAVAGDIQQTRIWATAASDPHGCLQCRPSVE